MLVAPALIGGEVSPGTVQPEPAGEGTIPVEPHAARHTTADPWVAPQPAGVPSELLKDRQLIQQLEQEKQAAQEESARLRRQLNDAERRLRDAAREQDVAEAQQRQSQLDSARMVRLEQDLRTARERLRTVEQQQQQQQQQQQHLPSSDAARADAEAVQLSAATITVLTAFGRAGPLSESDLGSSPFRSPTGLLGVQLNQASRVFSRLLRLFHWYQKKLTREHGTAPAACTVEDLLVDREKKFLNEAAFRKRYQESLQEDPEPNKRVWKTGDHDELRAVFSAYCRAKQAGPVNLSQQLPPNILQLPMTDLAPELLDSCRKLQEGPDDASLLLKSPERVVKDFVRRYQQGFSVKTAKSGVQHAELAGQAEQRVFTGFDLFPDLFLEPPQVEGMESKFPVQRIMPLGSQTKLILTAWEFDDGVDTPPFQAGTRWQLKADATITVQWSTLEASEERAWRDQHVLEYIRFNGDGFQRQEEVFNESGDVISYAEMSRRLRLKFGDRDAQMEEARRVQQAHAQAAHASAELPRAMPLNERALMDLARFDEEAYQTLKHVLLATANQHKQAVFMAAQRNEHPPTSSEDLPSASVPEPAEVHKAFRCIVQFEDFPFRFAKRKSWLDERALDKAMEGLKRTFKGSDVIDKCKTAFSELTHPPDDAVKMTRGLLLWGPPGTGKTTIMENLAEAAGFHMIVKPFAGADINSGKVGDTEKILGALTDRSHQLQWAPCCLVIDEIDALAPDRDAKASEHKVDALSKLLSVFGGIDDHRNLFVFGATNRKTDMDKAFLRRLEAKFYVGVPDPDARRAFIIGKLPALASRVNRGLTRSRSVETTVELLNSLVNLTTNFSGANIEKLCAKVSKDLDADHQRMSEKILVQAKIRAREVCEVEDILIGDRYLPDLLQDDVRGEGEMSHELATFLLDSLQQSNGKILADLSGPTQAVRDHINVSELPRGVVEMQLAPSVGIPKVQYNAFDWAHQGPEEAFTILVTALTKFAIDRRVRASLIKVVTGSSMTRAKKYDENSMLHELEAIVAECRENACAIICFDLESLVRVQTDEGGPSERPRVLNTKLLFGILDIVRQHAVNVAQDESTSTPKKMLWICIASTHPYLTQQVQTLLRWPKNEMEQHLESREREETTCIKCGLPFSLQGDDGQRHACKYHRDRFAPLNNLKLIPTFDRPERPPEREGRDRIPRPAPVKPTYYDALEIPSVLGFMQQKTRETGRQHTYAHWRAHVDRRWVEHGWGDKEKNKVMWSCCGATGIWSQGCDDCDDPRGHERDQTFIIGGSSTMTPQGRNGVQLEAIPTQNQVSTPLPSRNPPKTTPITGGSSTMTPQGRNGFQLREMPLLPPVDPPPRDHISTQLQQDPSPAPPQAQIDSLVRSGVPADKAAEALRRENSDLNRAASYYFDNTDKTDDWWSPQTRRTGTGRVTPAPAPAQAPEPEPEPEYQGGR